MSCRSIVPIETFSAIENVDIDQLSSFSNSQLRPILPCLVRMSLCAPLDSSAKWTKQRKKILKCLSGIEIVNSLVGLLSIDFHALEQDARKEQQLRVKQGSNHSESVLISQLENSVALEFEKTDAARKLRLLLSELLFIISKSQSTEASVECEFYMKNSELFASDVYIEEVADVLCIAQAELPDLLPVTEVAEALLHVNNGSWLLTRLVANVPDSFKNVCRYLVMNGEKQDEDLMSGQMRGNAIKALCEMCPQQALVIRNMCIEQCRLPGLAVTLTLLYGKTETEDSDIVSFISGLLLGNNVNTRTWIAQYIRNGQKRKDPECSLVAMRQALIQQLHGLLEGESHTVRECDVVKASAFIRLYCAMKGIAALRFNDEESKCLLHLLTSRPVKGEAGGRFVSLSLCMLLACPYLLSGHEQDRMAVDWLKWLVSEADHFELGKKSSFGEMLLLIAIHFHSNQNNAIADLVSNTLGMKSAVKANALSKIRQMFTVEIFTEQVVTSHAVKVSVTPCLNADISGHLPVHCIYQLLKSRAFSKHRVPIKTWIYKQICACTIPIHPVMPSLIEVYINSILLPNNKSDRTNEPITEKEVLDVFKNQIVFRHQQSRRFSSTVSSVSDELTDETSSNFTSQVLLLYYLLLYQDTVYNNMKTFVHSGRQVHEYSTQLWAQLPLKYLLQQAHRQQKQYAGLFSPLLRLLATHYPHLCLIEDWLDEELTLHDFSAINIKNTVIKTSRLTCDVDTLQENFDKIGTSSSELILLLDQLLTYQPPELLHFADVLVANLTKVLPQSVPRKIKDDLAKLWVQLNTVMPRRLRMLTVNALCHSLEQQLSSSKSLRRTGNKYSEEDFTLDPLLILTCDPRVFRCPPLMQIVLRVLEAASQASKIYFVNHAHLSCIQEKTESAEVQDKEQLRDALIATQESSIVQLLLETCLPTEHEKKEAGILSELREVQGIVCSYLHQKFIADPSLVKLVHFQGYPSELVPIAVNGIPSMHICVDFIPELLSQPDMQKQIFAIELVSHLSTKYALPKTLAVAKLAVNVMATLITVLPSDTRPEFFMATLASLCRITEAFPPLCDEAVTVLIQLGKVCTSHLANCESFMQDYRITDGKPLALMDLQPQKQLGGSSTKHSQLFNVVQATYTQVVKNSVLIKDTK